MSMQTSGAEMIEGAFGVRASDGTDGLDWSYSAPLRDYAVVDATGRRIARVIGRLLRGHAGPGLDVGESEVRVSVPCTTLREFEDVVVRGLNGTFVVETLVPLPRRLYPDVGGTVPVVYCPETRRLASSAGLLFDDAEYRERFLADRHHRLMRREAGGGAWIPGFLTAHAGVHRLLPNFALDLSDWTSHRHWPRSGEVGQGLEFDDGVERVVSLLRDYVDAVAAEFGSIATTLTAGFDSRVILAACRDHAARIDVVTMDYPSAVMDVAVARKLTRQLGLRHRVLPMVRAPEAEMRRWDRLVGDVTHEVNRERHPTLGQVGTDVMFTGLFGETGRCNIYRAELGSINAYPSSARLLAGRVGLTMSDPEVQATLERWLQTLPDLPTSAMLDIGYHEIRMGGWAMAQRPAQSQMQFALMPFGQYGILDAFVNVAPDRRTGIAMFGAIAHRLWPETMALPVNRYDDLRDLLTPLRKLTDRRRVTRGLRRLSTRFLPAS